MLELTWPGKSAAAQRAVGELDAGRFVSWSPQCGPTADVTRAGGEYAHRVIAGDNLPVLKCLRSAGARYDVIYIDPPYNTGSTLTYNDKKQGKSSDGGASAAWLTEIYPRLLLARELLFESGVLFVSIDDNEACHLLTILREIFGHANHIGTIKWRRKRKPSFLDRHMSALFEYVVVFARDAKCCPRLLGGDTEESTRPVLNASNKIVERIVPVGFQAFCADGIYPAGEYKNRSLAFELLDDLGVTGGKTTAAVRVRGPFRIQQDLWAETGFITKHFGLRRRVLPSERKRRHAEDDGTSWPTNEDAQEELQSIFGERVFDFPKPVGLLSQLLAMVPATDASRPQHCLDFYAGSGSFLIAALEQSRADGQRRTVDLVQNRESLRHAGAFQFTDIAEICAHRVCVDSTRRGFTADFDFLQLEQQE